MSIEFVIKRNGAREKFTPEKIEGAVWKAVESVGGTDREKCKSVCEKIVQKIESKYSDTVSVEQVQDIVEEMLIKMGFDRVAKSYILYRHQHNTLRNVKDIMQDVEMIDKYLNNEDWLIKENANTGYSLQGLNFNISQKVSANYWLTKVYPPELAKYHHEGDIHIHDLGGLAAYCFSGDTKVPLLNGETLTFKDLVKKYKNKKFEVYSIDENNNIVAGTAYNPRLTRKNTDVIQVTLDNDKKIICTPDHPFMMRDGSYKRADKLEPQDSLMPAYIWKNFRNTSYTGVYNPGTNKKEYLHRHLLNANKDQHIHHINHIKTDNRIENLELMGSSEHRGMEFKETMKRPLWKSKNLEILNKRNKTKEMRVISSENAIKRNKTNIQRAYTSYTHSKLKNKPNIHRYLSYIQLNGFIPLKTFISLKNHKVKSIKSLNKKIDVYDLSVEKYHNFALDSGVIVHNCVGWDLKQLLLQGFNGVEGKVSSGPPKHFRSALGQVVNFIFTLQNEAQGAQAFSNFDTYLAPFIRFDKLDRDQVKQALQEFLFNMNVTTRQGGQSPFSNITLDLKVPSHFKNNSIIIGGKLMPEKYGDFQSEMDLFNDVLFEIFEKGDFSGRPFTFPIPTINIDKNFDFDNPSHNRIWRITAKYGTPYFSNYINSDINPEDTTSMCPLSGDEKVLYKSNCGNLQIDNLRALYRNTPKNFEVYSNGEFIKAKINKFDNKAMLKVTLNNGHSIIMSTDHENLICDNYKGNILSVPGKDLHENMWLPYSCNQYEGSGGTYELGYLVGAFAGDGSFNDGYITYSLNNELDQEVKDKLIKYYTAYFSENHKINTYKNSKLLTLIIKSKGLVGLCHEFIEGKKTTKHYTPRLYSMSKEFRKGVYDGHMDTDGGNRNRIYTSSHKMIQSLNMLASTLGTTTSIFKDDREKRFSDTPNHAVLFYQLKRDSYKDVFFKKDNKLWIKIKSIKQLRVSSAYCLEVDNKDHLFTIASTGILTHNCRLRIDRSKLERRGGGLFGSDALTGSVGVVTINMPRIGYLSKDEKDFFERLDNLIEISKQSLELKRKYIEKWTEQGLYPFARVYLQHTKDTLGSYWANHFSTIGLLGMNEACLNFLKVPITDPKGKEFAVKVMEYMREKILNFKKETGHEFNLEATPGEGTTRRFASIDKKKFNDIIVANEAHVRDLKAVPYYSNSTQIPVDSPMNLFEALDHQNSLQPLYTGGTVMHIYLGESAPNPESVKALIKKCCYNYRIPYFSITPTFSICPIHGYMTGKHFYCPVCLEPGDIVPENLK